MSTSTISEAVGVETEIKEDKQGLGTSKRNKKRFEAQYMLTLLEALAHNILIWTRQWLADHCPRSRSIWLASSGQRRFSYEWLDLS